MRGLSILRAPAAGGRVSVVGVVMLFLATNAAFVIPWAAVGDEGAEFAATRYSMFVDGYASLVRKTNANAEIVEWSSISVEVVPGFRALAELPHGFADAVAEHIAGDGAGIAEALAEHEALSRARIGIVSTRSLKTDGPPTTDIEVRVFDRRGLYTLGFQRLGGEQAPTIFDPPMLLLPADPASAPTWTADGVVGALGYHLQAEVTHSGALTAQVGHLDDCITVSSALTLDLPEGPDSTEILDQYCAGAGWVYGKVSGRNAGEFVTVSAGGLGPVALPERAPVRADSSDVPVGKPEAWQFSRVGSALPLNSIGPATFSPVYLATDPPTVLAGTEAGGDLVALGADGVSGEVAWRFPTSGAVYAQPYHHPGTDRIYFGATDGTLRALDARGLFLWSYRTADNIVTRPVVSGNTLVFGSEDSYVYGVDANTGRSLWRMAAGAPVISSPTLHNGLVVVADESGAVRAVDPLNGVARWVHQAQSRVQASLAASEHGVLVADDSGSLTLLDGRGAEVWSCEAGQGNSLLTEPAIGRELAVTIDEYGGAAAVSLLDGSVVWRLRNEGYTGSAAWAGGVVALAREDGSVDVLNIRGERVARLDARDATTPGDPPPAFTYGPSAGGGALWTADNHGVVRRLGPAPWNSVAPPGVASVRALLHRSDWVSPLISPPVVDRDSVMQFGMRRHRFVVGAGQVEYVEREARS